jgi:hypothetical protein
LKIALREMFVRECAAVQGVNDDDGTMQAINDRSLCMMPINLIAARFARRVFLFMACAFMVTAGMLAFTACRAGILPDHYTFSQHQVQAAVQRKFPYHHSVNQLFDITLANPVVTLQPERNRLAVQLDVHLLSPLLRVPVNGSFTVSSDLAWDTAKHAIVLHSPSVDSVNLDGDAAAYTQQVEAVLAPAATNLLAGYAVYTLKPSQLQWIANYQPGNITVLANGVRVQIVEK